MVLSRVFRFLPLNSYAFARSPCNFRKDMSTSTSISKTKSLSLDSDSPSPQNLQELFEVFDDKNVTTGSTIERGIVHKNGLFHRSVQVLLMNSAGDILVQRRHPRKDTAPDCWDLSCSEHLQPHEEYEQAALRGLYEELGVPLFSTPVTRILPAFLQENYYTDVGVIDREFVECWFAKYDGEIKVDGLEVVECKWIRWQQFLHFAQSGGEMQWAPWVIDSVGRIPLSFFSTNE
eukprot:m.75858 g.75858  ORF g.75858 m.75858 type:complete len:233 (-) comp24833_c1_seq1:60-758(-)